MDIVVLCEVLLLRKASTANFAFEFLLLAMDCHEMSLKTKSRGELFVTLGAQ